MKANRLISPETAVNLDLATRIRLEAQIADARAEAGELRGRRLPGSFQDYQNRSPWTKYLFETLGSFSGKDVLDLGCGCNPTPIYFALAGAKKVYACDVSQKAVAYVRKLAQEAGVGDRVFGIVCAAEQLPLRSVQVDIVHGAGVLHHLSLSQAGSEISRVLKNGGKGGFKDPLGHNWLLELARDYLPRRGRKVAKGTDRPLSFGDIQTFGENFCKSMYQAFGLSSMVIAFLGGRSNSMAMKMAHTVDAYLLRWCPFLQRLCRFVVTSVQK